MNFLQREVVEREYFKSLHMVTSVRFSKYYMKMVNSKFFFFVNEK